jgi:hypothetical protein
MALALAVTALMLLGMLVVAGVWNRPAYRQWRTLGRGRAEAFRLALWRE